MGWDGICDGLVNGIDEWKNRSPLRNKKVRRRRRPSHPLTFFLLLLFPLLFSALSPHPPLSLLLTSRYAVVCSLQASCCRSRAPKAPSASRTQYSTSCLVCPATRSMLIQTALRITSPADVHATTTTTTTRTRTINIDSLDIDPYYYHYCYHHHHHHSSSSSSSSSHAAVVRPTRYTNPASPASKAQKKARRAHEHDLILLYWNYLFVIHEDG
jgi:hypothetical protein